MLFSSPHCPSKPHRVSRRTTVRLAVHDHGKWNSVTPLQQLIPGHKQLAVEAGDTENMAEHQEKIRVLGIDQDTWPHERINLQRWRCKLTTAPAAAVTISLTVRNTGGESAQAAASAEDRSVDAIGAARACDRFRRNVDQQRDYVAILVLQDIAQLGETPPKGPQALRPERFTHDADLTNPKFAGNLQHTAQTTPATGDDPPWVRRAGLTSKRVHSNTSGARGAPSGASPGKDIAERRGLQRRTRRDPPTILPARSNASR